MRKLYTSQVNEKSCLILLLDDFHHIHLIRQPDTTSTSQAIHMALCLVDVHDTLPAIRILDAANVKLHREVLVTCGTEQQMCRGGICVETVLKVLEKFMADYHHLYLESLLAKCKEFDSTAAKACLQELR